MPPKRDGYMSLASVTCRRMYANRIAGTSAPAMGNGLLQGDKSEGFPFAQGDEKYDEKHEGEPEGIPETPPMVRSKGWWRGE